MAPETLEVVGGKKLVTLVEEVRIELPVFGGFTAVRGRRGGSMAVLGLGSQY